MGETWKHYQCSTFLLCTQGATGPKLGGSQREQHRIIPPVSGRVLCRHRGDKALAQEAYAAPEASATSRQAPLRRQPGCARSHGRSTRGRIA